MRKLERASLDTGSLAWETVSDGVSVKSIAQPEGPDRHLTSLIRLGAGAFLPVPPGGSGMEVVVLEGDWKLPAGVLHAGDYSRRPVDRIEASSTEMGCVLFVKTSPFLSGDTQPVHLESGAAPWSPGHGNLGVKSLHAFDEEGTAYVHWPAGERFMPHQHWGGEEIFVLSGKFMDEHGEYPAGTWLRSPHLSAHHPFVEEETVIFVKTGHLREA
ncbi:MAG: anti-sigma factor ChrR (cupin superfamily) [Planctomycetota bacterium]|jgi:anti-sigma factor ChrR (cupin superfamily)